MIILHMTLVPKDEQEQEFRRVYSKEFVPAIEKQEGFIRSNLMKKRESVREYIISITFEAEALRLKWVDTKEHAKVWPKIDACCQSASFDLFDDVPLA